MTGSSLPRRSSPARLVPLNSGTKASINGLHTTILGHTWIAHLGVWSYRILDDRSTVYGEVNFHALESEMSPR